MILKFFKEEYGSYGYRNNFEAHPAGGGKSFSCDVIEVLSGITVDTTGLRNFLQKLRKF
jgi:hypothetical protein